MIFLRRRGVELFIMPPIMTLRPPRPRSRTSPIDALDYEIAREQASALGRLGRALEAALAALDAHPADDAAAAAETVSRAQFVQEASDALWCFIVQREACGLHDPRPVIRDYRVPVEVQNRMGALVAPPRRYRKTVT
jgi:hypothetical protein